MNEIKADTSLYTDTVEKLRAITAVIEAQRAGSTIEWRIRGSTGEWADSGRTESGYSDCVLLDYRIKPKPRELWVMFDETGQRCRDSQDEVSIRAVARQRPGCTVVRFVEQP